MTPLKLDSSLARSPKLFAGGKNIFCHQKLLVTIFSPFFHKKNISKKSLIKINMKTGWRFVTKNLITN